MDERATTISQLLSQIKASNSVVRNLREMDRSIHFDGAVADLSSYLESSLRRGRRLPEKTTEGFLFRIASQQVGLEALNLVIRPAQHFGSSAEMTASAGLLAAFEDARGIRQATGGKDIYMGARHVLVAIVTSADDRIVRERADAMSSVGRFDLQELAVPLTVLIQQALEPGESLEEWRALFTSRGFDEAARHCGPAPAILTAVEAPHLRSMPFRPDAIARLKNDDPTALDPAEIVGDDEVANALSRVVAARDFGPPLAIGVFGPWGSGKSLFLRRVREGIAEVSLVDGSPYHREIIHIGFNAWHYVDADLWANLVGRIFEGLDAAVSGAPAKSGDGLLDQLTTARELALDAAQSLVERRQTAHEARARLRKAEDDLSRKRHSFAETLRHLAGEKARLVIEGRHLAASGAVRTVVEETYGDSIEEMAARWSGPSQAVASLRRSGLIWLEIRRRLGTVWSLAVVAGATILCVAAPHLVSATFGGSPAWPEWLRQLDPTSLAWTGFLTATAGRLAVVTRKAVVIRDAVVATVEAYRRLTADLPSDETGDLAAKRRALDLAEGSVEQARRSLSEAVDRQATAAADLAAQTPAQRLKSFVRDRAALNGPYRSREGLIGMIRRDFADLTTLMHSASNVDAERKVVASATAYKARLDELHTISGGALTPDEFRDLSPPALEDIPRSFKRIVLYIDDLDRCPADKVIDVLQAVHMLLAFPLFVVMVAVDVRWLEGALKDRYRQLGNQETAGRSNDRAAALDYLEKIFQLAVWTQPMSSADAHQLIRLRLLVASDAQDVEPPVTIEPPGPNPSRRLAAPTEPEPDHRPEVRPRSDLPAPLRVTEPEVAFFEAAVETLELSPRRLLRLINSYQVARTSLSAQQTDELLGGGFKGLIAILTISIATPMRFGAIADALSACDDWTDCKASLATQMTAGQIDALLSRWTAHLARENVSILDLRKYLHLSQRFSFSGPAGT